MYVPLWSYNFSVAYAWHESGNNSYRNRSNIIVSLNTLQVEWKMPVRCFWKKLSCRELESFWNALERCIEGTRKRMVQKNSFLPLNYFLSTKFSRWDLEEKCSYIVNVVLSMCFMANSITTRPLHENAEGTRCIYLLKKTTLREYLQCDNHVMKDLVSQILRERTWSAVRKGYRNVTEQRTLFPSDNFRR